MSINSELSNHPSFQRLIEKMREDKEEYSRATLESDDFGRIQRAQGAHKAIEGIMEFINEEPEKIDDDEEELLD